MHKGLNNGWNSDLGEQYVKYLVSYIVLTMLYTIQVQLADATDIIKVLVSATTLNNMNNTYMMFIQYNRYNNYMLLLT